MKQPILFALLVFLFLHSVGESIAQDQKEIKIKIMKNVDGEMKVFSKTYPSREAMENDPEFREFQEETGDSTTFILGSGKEGFTWNSDSTGRTIVIMDEMVNEGGHGMVFSKDHVIKVGGGNANAFFIETDKMDTTGGTFFFKRDDSDTFSIRTLSGNKSWVMRDGPATFHVRTSGMGRNMYINNPTSEEIRTAGLSFDKELKPESVEYMLNSSDGSLKLSFTASAGDLSVRVVNEKGNGIYSEEIAKFNGKYEKTINLSGQEAGTYFLEIRQGSKALVKKLIIE